MAQQQLEAMGGADRDQTGRGAAMKVWGMAGLMVVATAGVVWAEVKTGTTVNAYPKNTLQDGFVADAPDDQFLADDVKIVGEAPYQVIQLTKTFTPPEGYKFRKFRANEKVQSRIDEATKARKDPGDGKEWRYWRTNTLEYVDIWFDPEELLTEYFGGTNGEHSAFNAEAGEGPDSITVSAVLADSQKAAKFPLRCDGNLTTEPGPGTTEPHWRAWVLGAIDLDVDSDNTSTGPNYAPQRGREEDRLEGSTTNVGRLVCCSSGDTDGDGIPDFADWRHNHRFVKAVLDVSKVEAAVDYELARVKFAYSASDPGAAVQVVTNGGVVTTNYTLAEGAMRLWTVDSTTERNTNSVAEGGHWIPPNVPLTYAQVFGSAAILGSTK